MIRLIPEKYGVGFSSMDRLPDFAGKYREEQVGRYWNYYVTPQCQEWPEPISFGPGPAHVIDGFSPNLNKSLHVGHLRQLALAKSLSKILCAKFVSLLGASQGVYQYAVDELNGWFNFLSYHPKLYYDVLMPRDESIVPRYKAKVKSIATDIINKPFEDECMVWDGPKGQVIVQRSDGRYLYAFHDIAFANTVGPTHYITGVEQKEHFESLGLGNKHLPMGLVMGIDGKKMKSRTGDGVAATEIMSQIQEHLEPSCPDLKKLAWNVLAWNFLHTTRSQNVKYNPHEWTKADSPGMYITYTFARVKKALGHTPCWIPELTQEDANLIGFANYKNHFIQRSIDELDTAQLAHYTYDLARKLGSAYHTEKIDGGRLGFVRSVLIATTSLRECMELLGMFPLEVV